MNERFSGRIKSFDASKGYGFIERQGGKDVFFYISAIQTFAPRTLHAGQPVEFDIQQSPKGLQAVKIVFTH